MTDEDAVQKAWSHALSEVKLPKGATGLRGFARVTVERGDETGSKQSTKLVLGTPDDWQEAKQNLRASSQPRREGAICRLLNVLRAAIAKLRS
jgi:hypothetical protein